MLRELIEQIRIHGVMPENMENVLATSPNEDVPAETGCVQQCRDISLASALELETIHL
jgi:hypothetical protein